MTDNVTKPLPSTLMPPRPKRAFMIETTDNGAWLVRNILTQGHYAYVDFASMQRDLPSIMGEDG